MCLCVFLLDGHKILLYINYNILYVTRQSRITHFRQLSFKKIIFKSLQVLYYICIIQLSKKEEFLQNGLKEIYKKRFEIYFFVLNLEIVGGEYMLYRKQTQNFVHFSNENL